MPLSSAAWRVLLVSAACNAFLFSNVVVSATTNGVFSTDATTTLVAEDLFATLCNATWLGQNAAAADVPSVIDAAAWAPLAASASSPNASVVSASTAPCRAGQRVVARQPGASVHPCACRGLAQRMAIDTATAPDETVLLAVPSNHSFCDMAVCTYSAIDFTAAAPGLHWAAPISFTHASYRQSTAAPAIPQCSHTINAARCRRGGFPQVLAVNATHARCACSCPANASGVACDQAASIESWGGALVNVRAQNITAGDAATVAAALADFVAASIGVDAAATVTALQQNVALLRVDPVRPQDDSVVAELVRTGFLAYASRAPAVAAVGIESVSAEATQPPAVSQAFHDTVRVPLLSNASHGPVSVASRETRWDGVAVFSLALGLVAIVLGLGTAVVYVRRFRLKDPRWWATCLGTAVFGIVLAVLATMVNRIELNDDEQAALDTVQRTTTRGTAGQSRNSHAAFVQLFDRSNDCGNATGFGLPSTYRSAPNAFGAVTADGRCHALELHPGDATLFVKAHCYDANDAATATAPRFDGSALTVALAGSLPECEAATMETLTSNEEGCIPQSPAVAFGRGSGASRSVSVQCASVAIAQDVLRFATNDSSIIAAPRLSQRLPHIGARVAFARNRSLAAPVQWQVAADGTASVLSLGLPSGVDGSPTLASTTNASRAPSAVAPLFTQGESRPLGGFASDSGADGHLIAIFGGAGNRADPLAHSAETGATFSAWIRVSEGGFEGYLLAVVDAFVGTTGTGHVSPSLTSLPHASSHSRHQENEFAVKYGIWLSSANRSLAATSFDSASGAPLEAVFNGEGVVARLLDGGWHHIALTRRLFAGSLAYFVAVDGSVLSGRPDCFQCMRRDKRLMEWSETADAPDGMAPVENGALVAGAALAGSAEVFAVQSMPGHATPHRLRALTGLASHQNMDEAKAAGFEDLAFDTLLDRGGSYALGVVFMIAAVAGLCATVFFTVFDTRRTMLNEETFVAHAAGAFPNNRAVAATVASIRCEPPHALRSRAVRGLSGFALVFILFAQHTLLYFTGWEWPSEYREPFAYVFFAFALDFSVPFPGLFHVVSVIVQFCVLVAALFLLYILIKQDNEQFANRVVAPLTNLRHEQQVPGPEFVDVTPLTGGAAAQDEVSGGTSSGDVEAEAELIQELLAARQRALIDDSFRNGVRLRGVVPLPPPPTSADDCEPCELGIASEGSFSTRLQSGFRFSVTPLIPDDANFVDFSAEQVSAHLRNTGALRQMYGLATQHALVTAVNAVAELRNDTLDNAAGKPNLASLGYHAEKRRQREAHESTAAGTGAQQTEDAADALVAGAFAAAEAEHYLLAKADNEEKVQGRLHELQKQLKKAKRRGATAAELDEIVRSADPATRLEVARQLRSAQPGDGSAPSSPSSPRNAGRATSAAHSRAVDQLLQDERCTSSVRGVIWAAPDADETQARRRLKRRQRRVKRDPQLMQVFRQHGLASQTLDGFGSPHAASPAERDEAKRVLEQYETGDLHIDDDSSGDDDANYTAAGGEVATPARPTNNREPFTENKTAAASGGNGNGAEGAAEGDTPAADTTSLASMVHFLLPPHLSSALEVAMQEHAAAFCAERLGSAEEAILNHSMSNASPNASPLTDAMTMTPPPSGVDTKLQSPAHARRAAGARLRAVDVLALHRIDTVQRELEDSSCRSVLERACALVELRFEEYEQFVYELTTGRYLDNVSATSVSSCAAELRAVIAFFKSHGAMLAAIPEALVGLSQSVADSAAAAAERQLKATLSSQGCGQYAPVACQLLRTVFGLEAQDTAAPSADGAAALVHFAEAMPSLMAAVQRKRAATTFATRRRADQLRSWMQLKLREAATATLHAAPKKSRPSDFVDPGVQRLAAVIFPSLQQVGLDVDIDRVADVLMLQSCVLIKGARASPATAAVDQHDIAFHLMQATTAAAHILGSGSVGDDAETNVVRNVVDVVLAIAGSGGLPTNEPSLTDADEGVLEHAIRGLYTAGIAKGRGAASDPLGCVGQYPRLVAQRVFQQDVVRRARHAREVMERLESENELKKAQLLRVVAEPVRDCHGGHWALGVRVLRSPSAGGDDYEGHVEDLIQAAMLHAHHADVAALAAAEAARVRNAANLRLKGMLVRAASSSPPVSTSSGAAARSSWRRNSVAVLRSGTEGPSVKAIESRAQAMPADRLFEKEGAHGVAHGPAADPMHVVSHGFIKIEPLARRCPDHHVSLIPATERWHRPLAPDSACAFLHSTVFLNFCVPDDKRLWLQRPGATEHAGMSVCPTRGCSFAVSSCVANNDIRRRVFAAGGKAIYTLSRYGILSYVGLVALVIVQFLILPGTRSAFTFATCHISTVCDYRGCYFDPAAEFLLVAFFSGLVLLFTVAALAPFFAEMVWVRKALLLRAGLIAPTAFAQGAENVLAATRRELHGTGQALTLFGTDDYWFYGSAPGRRTGPERPVELATASVPALVWHRVLLSVDDSFFKPLYHPFRSACAIIQPAFLVWQVAAVLVVLFIGNPGDLRQLAAIGALEALFGFGVIVGRPFVDPSVNLLAGLACVHQVAILALDGFFRIEAYNRPVVLNQGEGADWATVGMIVVTSLTIVVGFLILLYAVLLPFALSFVRRQQQQPQKEPQQERLTGPSLKDGDDSAASDVQDADAAQLAPDATLANIASADLTVSASMAFVPSMALDGPSGRCDSCGDVVGREIAARDLLEDIIRCADLESEPASGPVSMKENIFTPATARQAEPLTESTLSTSSSSEHNTTPRSRRSRAFDGTSSALTTPGSSAAETNEGSGNDDRDDQVDDDDEVVDHEPYGAVVPIHGSNDEPNEGDDDDNDDDTQPSGATPTDAHAAHESSDENSVAAVEAELVSAAAAVSDDEAAVVAADDTDEASAGGKDEVVPGPAAYFNTSSDDDVPDGATYDLFGADAAEQLAAGSDGDDLISSSDGDSRAGAAEAAAGPPPLHAAADDSGDGAAVADGDDPAPGSPPQPLFFSSSESSLDGGELERLRSLRAQTPTTDGDDDEPLPAPRHMSSSLESTTSTAVSIPDDVAATNVDEDHQPLPADEIEANAPQLNSAGDNDDDVSGFMDEEGAHNDTAEPQRRDSGPTPDDSIPVVAAENLDDEHTTATAPSPPASLPTTPSQPPLEQLVPELSREEPEAMNTPGAAELMAEGTPVAATPLTPPDVVSAEETARIVDDDDTAERDDGVAAGIVEETVEEQQRGDTPRDSNVDSASPSDPLQAYAGEAEAPTNAAEADADGAQVTQDAGVASDSGSAAAAATEAEADANVDDDVEAQTEAPEATLRDETLAPVKPETAHEEPPGNAGADTVVAAADVAEADAPEATHDATAAVPNEAHAESEAAPPETPRQKGRGRKKRR